MRKHLSLIGVLLVLVGIRLMPKAEPQEPYVSPALLLGMNFDFSGDGGLEFYPSLSIQVSAGVYDEEWLLVAIAGTTLGYQLSLGHPNNLYVDLQGGLWPFGVGVGWAWQPSTKVSSFRSKLFFPSPLGLGIEYDSRKRLKPYLYGSVAPMLFLSSQ